MLKSAKNNELSTVLCTYVKFYVRYYASNTGTISEKSNQRTKKVITDCWCILLRLCYVI